MRFYFGHYTFLPRWHPKWLYLKATFSIYYVYMFSYFLRLDSINIIVIKIYIYHKLNILSPNREINSCLRLSGNLQL